MCIAFGQPFVTNAEGFSAGSFSLIFFTNLATTATASTLCAEGLER